MCHLSTELGMKKWITSNYHYMVPEFEDVPIQPDFSTFTANVSRGIKQLGKDCPTPVVIGPVTIAYLTKFASFSAGYEKEQRRSFLERLLPIYKDLLNELSEMGITEVQVHEAALVLEEEEELLPLFKLAYPSILPKSNPMAINMVSTMEDVGKSHYQWLISVPEISVLSLDFTRGSNLAFVEEFGFPSDKTLGAGLVDSRSVWSVNPETIKDVLQRLAKHVSQLRIQPSGSLQYVPWDLTCEKELLGHPAGGVLAFASQKLHEVVDLVGALDDASVLQRYQSAWQTYKQAVESDKTVTTRVSQLTEQDFSRSEAFDVRRPKQLPNVPLLPTTTIGSFPQTSAIRQLRALHKKGALSDQDYETAIDQQIALAIGIQEGLGLDILVHGEAERTDMVEFFAQQLEGMLVTQNGWVQVSAV
jgi:5-methyltetrahydropteroyltriglutamate--homocysteine methyltransferase